VVLCFIVGLPIRLIPRIREVWRHAWWLPFFLGAVGFVLMVMSWVLGVPVRDPTSNMDVQTFQPALALGGYLLSVFAALHFWFPVIKLWRRTSSDVDAKA